MNKKLITTEILFWAIICLLCLLTSCKKETASQDLADNWESEFIPSEKTINKNKLSKGKKCRN